MTSSPNQTIEGLIARLGAGDHDAASELINHACGQLRRLARKMLRTRPDIKRFEDTDDLLQNAAIRLHTALVAVKPDSPLRFFGLAAQQIRRELLDLARHYYGPEGEGKNVVAGPARHSSYGPRYDKPDSTAGPSTLAEWTELHQKIEKLPEEERQVFDLIFYQGMGREEAAQVLGVSERTVKRRWREARRLLHQAMKDGPPRR